MSIFDIFKSKLGGARMTDDDRRKIFYYLRRKTSYTAWSREVEIFDRFAEVFEKQVREQPIVQGPMFESDWTPFLTKVVKAQALYEEALQRLRQGDRTVFLQNSRGAMVEATILSEYWYVELINNGPQGDHSYFGKYVPAMEALMREFSLAVAERGYLQPQMANTPAPEAWDSFWPTLYAQLPLPAQLDDVPSPPREIVIPSGAEVPVFGIYEPQVSDGCMNYLLGGIPAPTLWETDGVESTGNALSVNWRLIWEDRRYLDGVIPAEERLYFPLAAASVAPALVPTADVVSGRSGEFCPQTGDWVIMDVLEVKLRIEQGARMPQHQGRDVIWVLTA